MSVWMTWTSTVETVGRSYVANTEFRSLIVCISNQIKSNHPWVSGRVSRGCCWSCVVFACYCGFHQICLLGLHPRDLHASLPPWQCLTSRHTGCLWNIKKAKVLESNIWGAIYTVVGLSYKSVRPEEPAVFLHGEQLLMQVENMYLIQCYFNIFEIVFNIWISFHF